METEVTPFRVLLAEDDPVSRTFLHETSEACGAVVTDCADGDRTLALARADRWDLLILDQHLPGLDGDVVLAALRTDPAAASHATPAIATSAAWDSNAEALQRAGFAEVLPKPMQAATLRAALRRQGCGLDARLDDEDALRACGSAEAVARLRRLFADEELPRIQDELDSQGEDLQALLPTLHRLRASCGFCGTRALAEAGTALHHAITTGGDPQDLKAKLEAFRVAITETRAALHAYLDAET